MAKELETLSLLDILPGSISGDKNIQAIAKALDPELQSVAHDIRETLIIPRIDELPEPVIDLLAWQWHVDFYELARSLSAKREIIKGSIQWHRKKGTVWAILKALEMFGVEGIFTPWWEIKEAKPYTFAVDARLTDEYWDRSDWEDPAKTVRRAIVESKAKRSRMSSLYVHIDKETTSEFYIGGAVVQSGHQVIGVEQDTPGDVRAGLWAGGAVAQSGHQVIGVAQDVPDDVQTALNVGVGVAGSFYMKIDMVA